MARAIDVTMPSMIKDRMLEVAFRIADRLVERSRVFEQSSDGETTAGRGLAGDAGVALFFASVLQAREDVRYRNAMHEYIKAAAHASGGYERGLFSGVYGLLAAVQYAMLVEPRYSGLKEKCVNAIHGMEQETSLRPYVAAQRYLEYDLVYGRAGEALSIATTISPDSARAACDYLVWLLEDPTRWFCAHPTHQTLGPRHDIGMAHGLAGMVAALAISAPPEERYERALSIGIRSLLEFYVKAKGWPAAVGAGGAHFGREGWCYGAPGCAAALLLASSRVGDGESAALAWKSLRAITLKHHSYDEAICHGYIGIALTIGAMEAFSGDFSETSIRQDLIERVVASFDPTAPFCYRKSHPEKGLLDSAHFLDGAAGIGLALITLAGECNASWLSLLGLPKPRDLSTVHTPELYT